MKNLHIKVCIAKVCIVGMICLSIAGCDNKAESGALIGGAGGALVGGLIGSKSHARAGEGALIGGAAGAIGGAVVGHEMDENDKADSRDNYNSKWHKRISIRDVENWSDQGMRDDLIIDRIDHSKTVFHLTASDQNELRDRGVSESVIDAMRDTERR